MNPCLIRGHIDGQQILEMKPNGDLVLDKCEQISNGDESIAPVVLPSIANNHKNRFIININQFERPTIDAVLSHVPLIYDPATKQLLLQRDFNNGTLRYECQREIKSAEQTSRMDRTKNECKDAREISIKQITNESQQQILTSINGNDDRSENDSITDSSEDLLCGGDEPCTTFNSTKSLDIQSISSQTSLNAPNRSSASLISSSLAAATSSNSTSAFSSALHNILTKLRRKKPPISLGAASSTTGLIFENRPPNLPAKDADEEEKHRIEYEEMIKEVKRKGAKREKVLRKKMVKKMKEEDQIRQSMKVWQNEILDDWENQRCSKKTLDLWWHGLPSNVRQNVWLLVIGNELGIDSELLVEFSDKKQLECECYEMIKLDVSRTFPNLGLFQVNNGPYHENLLAILSSYDILSNISQCGEKLCCRRGGREMRVNWSIGYCQGMSFLAAMFLLNMASVDDAFVAFVNLIHKTPVLITFFEVNESLMKAYYRTFEKFFQFNIPQLYLHFLEQKLTPDLYLVDWIYTLFAKSLPLDISTRIWDIFLRDQEEFIFRCSIAILKMYASILIEFDFIALAQYLTRLPEIIDEDKLFSTIKNTKMTLDDKKSVNGRKSFDEVLKYHIDELS